MAQGAEENNQMTTDAHGLPATHNATRSIADPNSGPEMDGECFTLPESILERASARQAGLTREELTFMFVEPTPAMEKQVAAFARGDQGRAGQRMIDTCLWAIGGKRVGMNQTVLDRWYKAIGTKGRSIVAQIFMDRFASLTAEELEEVKQTGKSVTC